jgi:cobalt-zinc-cadmium efflux system outer membrane protein
MIFGAFPKWMAWLTIIGLLYPSAGAAQESTLPSAQATLGLRETLDQVFRQHPSLRAAQQRLEASQAWARGAGVQPNPQLRLAVPTGDPSEESNSLVQRLEIAGQTGFRSRIAEFQVAQSDTRLLMQRRELGMKVVDAYFGLWSARELERLHTLRFDLARDLQSASQRRLQLGQISENVFLRSQLETAQAEAQLAQARAEQRIAMAQLNNLLQRPPSSDLVLPNTPSNSTAFFSEDTLPELTREKVLESAASRPEVKIAEISAQIAHLEGDLLGRQTWPDFEFEAYRSNLGARAEQGMRFSLVLPLWDWGQTRAAVERRQKEAEAAESDVMVQRQNVQQETLASWEHYSVARERRQILQEQTQRYLHQAELARRGYQAGLLTLLEVLEAQRAYREVMVEYVGAEATLQRRRWEVHWLTGGSL